MGIVGFISEASFPLWEESLLKEENFILVVQINGKVRDQISAPSGISKEEALEMVKGLPKVQKYLDGKTLRNVIFVPEKLINIVVS